MSTVADIELNVRSYRSALKSTLQVSINSLTNAHLKMDSILHPYGNNPRQIDTSALIYSLLRLPRDIDRTQNIVIGQTPEVFAQFGFPKITSWPTVSARARRRITHFNLRLKTLAFFASSISDIDDLTNTLIAFQSEWNKFHSLLKYYYPHRSHFKKELNSDKFVKILNLTSSDWEALKVALGPRWRLRLSRLYRHPLNLRLQLLAGSWIDYTKATQKWWKNIAKTVSSAFHISRQRIYFVSSNTHSLLNLFSGFVLKHQKTILADLKTNHPDLYLTYQKIQAKELFLHPNDFLYYAAQAFLSSPKIKKDFADFQQKLGIITIPANHYFDTNVQIFPLKNLLSSRYRDPRLKITHPAKIKASEVLIFNIDYPLGFAAYHALSQTLQNVREVKGVYILGKAAVLNSELGDLEIPRAVFDEHTQNTYMFKNCFNTFFPFQNSQGSILTNQKSVSVLGTFLENQALINTYSKNNFTIVEMETGPYLNAVTEATYDQQTPRNTIIDLNSAPFDLGIINYTSDTPYSKAKNLAAGSLELRGLEPVYLGSLAILQRIINLEEQP